MPRRCQRTITETTIGFFDRVVDLDQVESVILGTWSTRWTAAGPSRRSWTRACALRPLLPRLER